MGYTTLRYEKEGALGLVTIDRAQVLNALNLETLLDLQNCFSDIRLDKEVRVVILTGAGEKAFVAGADISHMQDLNSLEATEFARLGHALMRDIETLPKPVIAAVNGFALGGGCELALACDIRFASENAKFGQPEINLGIIPGFGGTQRLPRIVGRGIASELLFTGDMIDAEEALRIGLANKVVAPADLLECCREIAVKIAVKGPIAMRLCKETVVNGLQMDLDRANQYEANQFGHCFSSEDQKEGMKAFLEKRKPNFNGKSLLQK